MTRNRMYLETMQHVYSNTSKVMVDTRAQGNLLYLPLDKLMQAAAGNGASNEIQAPNTEAVLSSRGGSPISQEVPPQIVERSDNRSRDALRSRDREVRQ